MYLENRDKNKLTRLAFPALLMFWGVVAVLGFSNAISNVILEAVTAVGVYG